MKKTFDVGVRNLFCRHILLNIWFVLVLIFLFLIFIQDHGSTSSMMFDDF